MSFDADTLYALLPAVYRARDAARATLTGDPQGKGPLRQFVEVIAHEIAVLEEDVAQLYDNHFIETCADWVAPYIGDLIGYRQLNGATPSVRSPRAEVADTIRLRRGKGTAATLAQLAADVTGWDACVVEMFRRLATSANVNHVRTDSPALASVKGLLNLEQLGGPYESQAHTVDVRLIANGRGRYNIGNVAIFLWRLRSYSLTGSPAFKQDAQRYLFHPLGAAVNLYHAPSGDVSDPEGLGANVQAPLTRYRLAADGPAFANSYGDGRSFSIAGVTAQQIVVCNLSDAAGGAWAHQPAAGKVAVDPVLGRIAFGTAPAATPTVSFHYGFSANFGGGEYDRAASIDPLLQPVVAAQAQAASWQAALDTVAASGGAFEVGDSGNYALTPLLHAAANKTVALRAADRTRPLLALGGELVVNGEAGAEITLDGLLVAGGALHVKAAADGAAPALVRISHCTFTPGAVSLIVDTGVTRVEIDRCILGGLRTAPGAQVTITDSIVDAGGASNVAFSGPDGAAAGGALTVGNCTIVGKVHASALDATNTIFLAGLAAGDAWTAPVLSDRRQQGGVRFSYLPPASRTPRRYRCQPADAASATRPAFTSLSYGDPGYGQLVVSCPAEIARGADDGSEMGVGRGLYQAQRETNLRVRLEEYARFDLEVGTFFIT